jgi:mannose-6-phosphate isomerase-like protein (cupin superfamily)
MSVRRVVTGIDKRGKACFVADEQVEPVALEAGGWAFDMLWGAENTPAVPNDGRQQAWSTYYPGPGGFRFHLSTIVPDDSLEATDARPDMVDWLDVRDLWGAMDPDDPGMHTNATLDMEVILSGEIILELDDGVERRLKPGDTVIQNGTRHRWRNPGPGNVLLAIFMLAPTAGPEAG